MPGHLEAEEGLTMWNSIKKWSKGIALTVASAGVFIGAMLYSQRDVPMPPLPVAQVAAHEWVLTNEYATEQSGYRFEFKSGFRTDFATIPSLLSPALGLTSDSPCLRRGALIHDGWYATHRQNKELGDRILEEAILADGCEPHKAEAVWQAVHNFGFVAWDSKTPESVQAAKELVTVRRASETRKQP